MKHITRYSSIIPCHIADTRVRSYAALLIARTIVGCKTLYMNGGSNRGNMANMAIGSNSSLTSGNYMPTWSVGSITPSGVPPSLSSDNNNIRHSQVGPDEFDVGRERYSILERSPDTWVSPYNLLIRLFGSS